MNVFRYHFDITQNRHGGNLQSEFAFEKALKSGKLYTDRFRVFEAIRESGSLGITCKELSEQWGVGMNHLSGRFSELKRDNKIKQIGRRKNSGVYVLSEEDCDAGRG